MRTSWYGLAFLLLLVGCSKSENGGSNSGGVAGDPVPRSLSYAATSLVLANQIEITPLYPTYYGAVATSFSISPALPTGLNFSTLSGRIAGTPEALSIARSYTITASNSKGSTTTNIIIQVVAQPPFGLHYTADSVFAIKGISNISLIPQFNVGVRGGATITSFSLNPTTLPAGLVFNSTLGSIEGTPEALLPPTTYTLTGTNTGGSTTTQITLEVLPEMTSLVAGGKNTCLFLDREPICWGDNAFGQLGNGSVIASSTPVNAISSESMRALVAGSESMCLLTTDFTSQCWGRNHTNQLGPTLVGDQLVPANPGWDQLSQISLSKQDYDAVGSRGQTCVLDLDASNLLRCYGEFSFGNFSSQGYAVHDGLNPVSSVNAVTNGEDFACYSRSGIVKCFGKNNLGQLGDNQASGLVSAAPVGAVGLNSGTNRIAAGKDFACGIKLDSLYCWGNNDKKQLAAATFLGSNSPVPIAGEGLPMGLTFLAAGAAHACVVADGKAYCWGDNTYGQLGRGFFGSNSAVPSAVLKEDATILTGISSLSVGLDHTCVIANNQPYCWGRNDHQQINNSLGDINRATKIIGLY